MSEKVKLRGLPYWLGAANAQQSVASLVGAEAFPTGNQPIAVLLVTALMTSLLARTPERIIAAILKMLPEL